MIRQWCGVLTIVCLAGPLAGVAFAQSQAPLTCEQQAVILDQLVGDVSARRHRIEIETAALQVRVRQLEADLKAATQKAATPPKTSEQ